MNRTMAKIVLLIAGISLLLSGSAFAENRSAAFTLTPMAGYHMIDGGMDLDNDAAFGLALGYNINRNWGIETDLRYTPTQTDRSGGNDIDVDIWTLGLGALYHFQPEEALNPYLAFGAGGMVYDVDGVSGNDEDYMGYWGGGVKYALSDSAALRLDLRHILDYRSDSGFSKQGDTDWRHHMQAMFGVTFQFGGESSEPVKETRAVEPAPVVAQPVAQPVDSDGDGVNDGKDKCPGTPAGVRVDAVGCPDDVDPVAELILQLNFDTNQDAVTHFHQSELAEAAKFINKFPGHRIEVEGHTDSVGDEIYNQNLSARRAENVLKTLVEYYGVAADRTTARGFGEDKPLASNDTAGGRQVNRRVEIEILP
jgi:OOP family OmpA-OmpF porin